MPIQGVIGFEQVSAGTTATNLTTTGASSGNRPNAAEIVVEGAAIRYRLDGTAPTASVGTPVEVGGTIVLVDHGEVEVFSAISRDGGTATLNVHRAAQYIP